LLLSFRWPAGEEFTSLWGIAGVGGAIRRLTSALAVEGAAGADATLPHVQGYGVAERHTNRRLLAVGFSLVVLHRALPDLQRMKLLLFCCRVVGTEVGILFGAIKPDL
jgi:hypothetical protein